MKLISFGTEVGAWSSTPRLDAWSSAPGLFTSRPQYGLEPEGLFGVHQAMSDEVGELSTGWQMSRAGWEMPEHYITLAEANAAVDKMVGEHYNRFLGGGAKYANRDEAEKAFVDLLYKKKVAIVKSDADLPKRELEDRKEAGGKLPYMSGEDLPMAAIEQKLRLADMRLKEADQNPQAKNAAATALVSIIALGVGAALIGGRSPRRIED